MHPGLKLDELRELYGISKSELARQMDFSVAYVSEVLKGTRPISATFALRIGQLPGYPSARTLMYWWADYQLEKAVDEEAA